MRTKIYGASDDLIEIEGAVTEEVNVYLKENQKVNFLASDGTSGKISYDGEWHIEVINAGDKYKIRTTSVGDDAVHGGDAAGCSGYSDVLILNDGIDWVKIGRKTFKRGMN